MNNKIETFSALGDILASFATLPRSGEVVRRAVADNGWFSERDVLRAVDSIRVAMLRRPVLEKWLDNYKFNDSHPRTVAIVMAGNIPLVGFFDMMCVVISGNRALVKPSAKDSALINYIIDLLRELDSAIAIENYDDQTTIDAVIATGSDNANRYFKAKYGDIPAIFRANRHSVAVLTGAESDDELRLLADDIFVYNGLGCRSVSHLLLAEGFDVERLRRLLSKSDCPGEKYCNNYRQQKALKELSGEMFLDGGFFTLSPSADQPDYISDITYEFYNDTQMVAQWIELNDKKLQCVVSNHFEHPYSVPLASAQTPQLDDYPDRVDVMKFLEKL